MRLVLIACIVASVAGCEQTPEVTAVLSADPAARSLQCYYAAIATEDADLYSESRTPEEKYAINLRDRSRIKQAGWIAVQEDLKSFSGIGQIPVPRETIFQEETPASYWDAMLELCHSAYPETSDNHVIVLPSEDDEALLQCYSLAENASLETSLSPPPAYRQFQERNLERFALTIEEKGLFKVGASPLEEGSIASITREYLAKTSRVGRGDRVLQACLARFPE